MAGTALSFDSFSMQSANVVTGNIEDGDAPDRDVQVFNLVNASGGVIGDDSYYTKTIPCSGQIQSTTVPDLESLIDGFHKAMSGKNKNLDVGYGVSTRRYVATPKRVRVTRGHRSMVWAPFELEFLCTGFGRDTSTTSLVSAQTHTTASKTNTLSIGGSAPEQMLRTQVTVTAATGLDDRTIGIKNNTTGELLSVRRTWVVGDILVVDYAVPKVQVNGLDVDFSGALPNFATGSHDHIVTNDFTTRTLTVTIDHTRLYL